MSLNWNAHLCGHSLEEEIGQHTLLTGEEIGLQK